MTDPAERQRRSRLARKGARAAAFCESHEGVGWSVFAQAWFGRGLERPPSMGQLRLLSALRRRYGDHVLGFAARVVAGPDAPRRGSTFGIFAAVLAAIEARIALTRRMLADFIGRATSGERPIGRSGHGLVPVGRVIATEGAFAPSG